MDFLACEKLTCSKRQNTNILFPSRNDVDGRINIINI